MDLSSGEHPFSSRPSSHLQEKQLGTLATIRTSSCTAVTENSSSRTQSWNAKGKNKLPASSFPQPRLQFRLWTNKNPGYIIKILDSCEEFYFSVAVLHKEVRGQGQLQRSSHGVGRDSVWCSKTLQMLGNTSAAATAGQPGGRTLQGNSSSTTDSPTLHQQELHCNLTNNIFSFITLNLICFCFWFHVFLPNCLLSPVLCHLCYCWICTTKLNQKREEDIWLYSIYR